MSNISLISSNRSVSQRLYYPGIYPKMVTFDAIQLFEKHPMFRVALDFHLKYGMLVGNIRVVDNFPAVDMVREDGFNEVSLVSRVNSRTNAEEIDLYVYVTPANNNASKLCGSSKPKYLISKYDEFRKNESSDTTDKVIREALLHLDTRITSRVDTDAGKYSWGSGLVNCDEIAREIIEFSLGRRDNISQSAINKANDICGKAKEKADVYAQHVADLRDLFGKPKFLIATPSEEFSIYRSKRRHGLIFGVIEVTSFTPCTAVQLEPMRWYHSLHDLPSQYKDEVLAKLTFAKLSRNPPLPKNEERDPDGYLPPVAQCAWNKPLNMAYWSGSYSSQAFQWIMFPKS